MISDVDRTLENLFKSEFGTALPFDLSFAIPDKSFSPVSNSKNTLNCYLYDIREDRELRQVAPRMQQTASGFLEKEYPPARIKLSYCLTSWSPALVTTGTPPAFDEHSLLSQVLQVLLKYPTLPEGVLVGMLVGQQPPLPTTAVLPDGIKNSSDFWNAIGGQLRPSLEYSVTISLNYQTKVTGPMVHTMQVDIDHGEMIYVIGGTVFDSANPPNPLAGAWVRVVQTEQTYVTDREGHYRIERILPGTYDLVVRAVGFQEGTRSIQVPLTSGNYDIILAP